MNKSSQSGFVISSLVVKIAIALAVLIGGVFVTKKVIDRDAPSKNAVALNSEKADAAKTGQQFAAATTKEVALAKDQTDPAIVAARKTSARADVALATGLGSFTPEQAKWVQDLVEADAAGFTASLASKDAQLVETGNKISVLQKAVDAEKEHSGWLEKVIIGLACLGVFILYVLPYLEKVFPPLALFVGAIQMVVNPALEDIKSKAKAGIAAAEAKAKQIVTEVGAAVTDMRAKLGGSAPAAIQHLDNNLSTDTAAAVAKAAQDAAANQAATVAAAKAAVEIASA